MTLLVSVLKEDTDIIPEKTYRNYTTEKSIVAQVLLQYYREDIFVFTKIVNSHRLNRE